MRHQHRFSPLWLAGFATIASGLSGAPRADVTIEEQSTFDFSVIKAHGSSTELTTTDKQRRDSTFNCEGFMSMLCGNSQSGEIIRLDRDVLEHFRRYPRYQTRINAILRAAMEHEKKAG